MWQSWHWARTPSVPYRWDEWIQPRCSTYVISWQDKQNASWDVSCTAYTEMPTNEAPSTIPRDKATMSLPVASRLTCLNTAERVRTKVLHSPAGHPRGSAFPRRRRWPRSVLWPDAIVLYTVDAATSLRDHIGLVITVDTSWRVKKERRISILNTGWGVLGWSLSSSHPKTPPVGELGRGRPVCRVAAP